MVRLSSVGKGFENKTSEVGPEHRDFRGVGETAAWVHSSVMATTSYWFLIVAPHLASDVCILGVRLEVSDCSRTFAPGRLRCELGVLT